MPRKPADQAVYDAICAYYIAGNSVEQTANRFDRSPAGIHLILHKHGVELRQRRGRGKRIPTPPKPKAPPPPPDHDIPDKTCDWTPNGGKTWKLTVRFKSGKVDTFAFLKESSARGYLRGLVGVVWHELLAPADENGQ